MQVPSVAVLRVYTTVPAHKRIVEALGGPYVQVITLLTPQVSDELYEPTVEMMRGLSGADLWIGVGTLPLERHLRSRIHSISPRLVSVFLLDPKKAADPHVWLSLRTTVTHLPLITDQLCSLDPQHRHDYLKRLRTVQKALKATDLQISRLVSKGNSRAFIIGHPTLAYFSQDYGFTQLAIDHHQGKPPTPQSFKTLVQQAKRLRASSFVVQKDTPRSVIQSVVHHVNVHTVHFEALSENYPQNLVHLAQALSQHK
jgi:zinc transport system substrate-binding protein